MFNEIKACIFDLDGVIVDTAKYHYLAWKRLAAELGFEFTAEHNERLKGISRMASLEILLEVGGITLTDQEKQRLAEKKNTWYVEYITKMDKSEILPGVSKFLTELKQANIKIALGSASKNAVTILRLLQLEDFFDVVVDGNKVAKAKPDPEVFLLGAQQLGVEPQYCVVFEDAEAGIEAAKAGGMLAVGVGDPQILGDADLVINGFTDFTVQHLLSL